MKRSDLGGLIEEKGWGKEKKSSFSDLSISGIIRRFLERKQFFFFHSKDYWPRA